MFRTRFLSAVLLVAFSIGLAQAAAPPKKPNYPFVVQPDQAFGILAKLNGTAEKKFDLTDDERTLFADAKDGKLDKHSFAEACLIASGVTDAAKRQGYLTKLDTIEADARKELEGAKTPAEQSARLLKFLHAGPMKGGYVSKQTDLHTVLDDGTFNCVSSAALFNVIGRRLGLDLVAFEVPEHVFSALRDGDKRIDVETTSPEGFDPKGQDTPKGKSPADRYAGKRREVGELGLAAVIAYNHGVEMAAANRHHEAALAAFRSLSLDPTNPGAANNVMAAFTSWGIEFTKAEQYEEALAVVAAALKVAPKDRTLLNNHEAFWQHYAEARMKAGKDEEALAILRRAAKAIPTADFEVQQAYLYIEPAQKLIADGKWAEALEVYTSALGKVDPKAKANLKSARVGLFLDWAKSHTDAGEFEKALEVLGNGDRLEPKNGHISNNTVAAYDAWARTLMEMKDWAGAMEIYEKGLRHLPGNSHLKNNLAYCKQEQSKR